jgi:uncharacterized phage infection (PIP) family protein YhgE
MEQALQNMSRLDVLTQCNNKLNETVRDNTNSINEIKTQVTEINKILSDLKENAVVMNDLNILIDDLKSELNNFITSNTPRNTDEIDRIKNKLNDMENRLNSIPDIRVIETARSNSRVPKLNLKKK